jgi:hypothetical protein
MLCDAYEKAVEEGKKHSMNVIFSPELSLCGNHYLLYGVTREFLKLREDIFDISLDELYAHLKAHGITVIQAHPYRDDKCQPHPHHVDGFEINVHPKHENYNERTLEIAAEYDMPLTVGSDVHGEGQVGLSATLSEEKIESIEQYLELLFARKLTRSVGGSAV